LVLVIFFLSPKLLHQGRVPNTPANKVAPKVEARGVSRGKGSALVVGLAERFFLGAAFCFVHKLGRASLSRPLSLLHEHFLNK
jgi:hypothetical protein